MTYLILTTINPELAILKEMKELKPVTGIYLCETEDDCDEEGEGRRYFASDTPVIKDFDARWIKFIDDTDELISVFVYRKEYYQADAEGDIIEIKNEGDPLHPIPGFVLPGTGPFSFEFLWNRPGVYLYEKTNCQIDLRPPLYLSGSTVSLGGDWNKKAQSVIIRHPSEQICKGAVFFTDPGYEGRCGDISVCWDLWPAADLTTSVDDLSVGDGSTYFSSIGNNEISSVHLYTVDTTKEYPGNITFYDEINCKGNELPKEPALGALQGNFSDPYPFSDPPGTWNNRVLSFRINGEYKVILRTEDLPNTFPPSNAQDELKCQGHWEIDETGCVNSVKGTTIYDPDPNNAEERPSSFQIIPAE